MTDPRCEPIREILPGFVADRLSQVESVEVREHLVACEECRAEAELVRLLYTTRPPVPTDLVDGIEGYVRFRRRAVFRPWWGVAAAAVAAVALGIGVTSRTDPGGEEVPAYVAEMQELSPWVSDDGFVAGAPAFDGLSDEALMTLLEELGAGGSGGAA